MEITNKIIKIARTRTGIPCLWESLMTFSDLSRSTVILDAKGNPKPAVFLNEEREKQALVPITEGDYICKSFEDKNGVAISIFKILSINSMKNEAEVTPIYRKSSLEKELKYPSEYKTLVMTTTQKLYGEIGVVSFIKEKEALA
jgi:hypothetical protein